MAKKPARDASDGTQSGIPPYSHNDPTGSGIDFTSPTKETQRTHSASIAAKVSPVNAEYDDARFIGDLNPEGVFLAEASPQDVCGAPSDSGIGLWSKRKAEDSLTPRKMIPPSSILSGLSPAVQQILLPIVREDCLSTLPPPFHRQALCAMYVEKFDPIFPVVDLPVYNGLSEESPSRVLLEQAMCLIASMTFASKPHLLLGDEAEVLEHKAFGKRVFAAMRMSIETSMVREKTILIQALCAMSFFSDGPESSELSSTLISRTITYAWSLGLHVQERGEDVSATTPRGTLLCIVWVLDRLNATLNGRAVIMHERDVERPLQECFSSQKPAFRLLLQVIQQLESVITLYRPRADESSTKSKIEESFALFEDLVSKCGCNQIANEELATVELLYHAVAILSHRSTLATQDSTATSFSKARRALSVDKITAMMVQDYDSSVTLFPFAPYAVTLASSVNYREMRRSKVPLFRARARVSFEKNCAVLRHLGEIFWSAAVIADMGKLTLGEVDRAYARFAVERRATIHDISSGTLSEAVPQDMLQQDIQSTTADVDPFYFTEMPNLEPFDMFDPEFDLNGVDAYLEGNLDRGGFGEPPFSLMDPD